LNGIESPRLEAMMVQPSLLSVADQPIGPRRLPDLTYEEWPAAARLDTLVRFEIVITSTA
jgi:hypothetical protein